MAEDWGAIALYLGYTNELEMLTDMYVTRGMSCQAIATRVGMKQATVLRRLRLSGIERRQRGGPQSSQRQWHRLHLLDQRYVFNTSLSVVAKHMQVSVSLVYKYKRAMKGGWNGFFADSADERPAEVSGET
jgi:transposase